MSTPGDKVRAPPFHAPFPQVFLGWGLKINGHQNPTLPKPWLIFGAQVYSCAPTIRSLAMRCARAWSRTCNIRRTVMASSTQGSELHPEEKSARSGCTARAGGSAGGGGGSAVSASVSMGSACPGGAGGASAEAASVRKLARPGCGADRAGADLVVSESCP